MNNPSSIRRRLAACNAENRAAFVPFLMAGDPDLDWTQRVVERVIEAGADLIELGVPFSDPVADGKVNQRAAERALAQGTRLESVLTLVERLRARGSRCPILLFTYFNPVLNMGLTRFAQMAKAAGIDGILVVDLPPEEASDYIAVMHTNSIDTVFLASPTTSAKRLSLIDAASSGFVYYVSRLGVTGKTTPISQTLAAELDHVRTHISQPIAVGFGVSTPKQVHLLAQHADAVVVGSALVKFNESLDPKAACHEIETACRALAAATPRIA